MIPQEEFDYQTLLCALHDFASPRDKITQLLRQGTIIRVRKGLYVFGAEQRKRPYCREVLANLVYGPSYISLEYGLQFYGLIPERVETVTSVAVGRSRSFSTPVGEYDYRQISLRAFSVGMDLLENSSGFSFMIAVPEKVLVDKTLKDRGISLETYQDIDKYLQDDLRIDLADLKHLKVMRIAEYAAGYRSRKAALLADFIKDIQG